MSVLRRCGECQTLNNTTVNDEHCYHCQTPWSEQQSALVVTDPDGSPGHPPEVVK